MDNLKKEHNTAIVLITHDMGVVSEMADDILVMYMGNVIESGTAREVLKNPQHPYTKALLSAVPNPNPYIERTKELLVYDPSIHDYSVDGPKWVEILPDHFVYGNERELDGYRKELNL